MAVKKQVDISCMFCSNTPCTCDGVQKKKAAIPRKKLASQPASPSQQADTKEESPPPVKRASLATMSARPAEKAEEDSEREALTALFKGGFMLEPVGDKRGFEAVRPMLNMSPVDIDIALWKMKRSQCQARQ